MSRKSCETLEQVTRLHRETWQDLLRENRLILGNLENNGTNLTREVYVEFSVEMDIKEEILEARSRVKEAFQDSEDTIVLVSVLRKPNGEVEWMGLRAERKMVPTAENITELEFVIQIASRPYTNNEITWGFLDR